jgi:hypothetical protein
LTKTFYNVATRIVRIGGILVQNSSYIEISLARSDLSMLTVYKSQVLDNVYFMQPSTPSATSLELYKGGNSDKI